VRRTDWPAVSAPHKRRRLPHQQGGIFTTAKQAQPLLEHRFRVPCDQDLKHDGVDRQPSGLRLGNVRALNLGWKLKRNSHSILRSFSLTSRRVPVFMSSERIDAPAPAQIDTNHQNTYCWGMEVDLTPDQTAFIRQAIDAGRLHRPEEAVREALSLWEERERRRAEILAAVDIAKASLAAGQGRVITEDSMRQLADEVKQRGRTRLAAEQQTPR
jgi:putative addiction module CopG family antidote